jgi:GT2 family glycosyltransferase
MNDISIIIVNYRGGDKLKKCLQSLQNIKDNRFSFEIIVVDNKSNTGREAEFLALFPQCSFISNSGNNGFANGCNLGASYSTGTYLLFLNPDTSVNADALFDMLEEVRVRPEYSIVSCSQVREDGSKDRPYGMFLTVSTLTGWLRAIRKIFVGSIEKSVDQTMHYVYPDWVSGSVLMIKKDSFLRLGKWDDDFWMYFEDVDLCRRAKLMHGEIVKLKSAVVEHLHGGSSRLNKDITVMTKTEVHISRHVYIAKHEMSENAVIMHLILILNNLVLSLPTAILGTIFFFVKPCHIYALTYTKLARYYLNVLKTGIWLSPRSVNYPSWERASVKCIAYSEIKEAFPMEW